MANISNTYNIIALLEDTEKYELHFSDGKLFVSKRLLNNSCELIRSRSLSKFKDTYDNTIDLKQFPKRYFAFLYNYLTNNDIPTTFIDMMEFINIASYLCVNNFKEQIASRIPVINSKDLYENYEKYEDLFTNDYVFAIFLNELISYLPIFTIGFSNVLHSYYRNNGYQIKSHNNNASLISLYIKGSCLGVNGYCCVHPKPISDTLLEPNEMSTNHKYCYENCDDIKADEIPPIEINHNAVFDDFWHENSRGPVNNSDLYVNELLTGEVVMIPNRRPNNRQLFVDKSRCCKHIHEIKELEKLMKYAEFTKRVINRTIYNKPAISEKKESAPL
jgi:hypothetical protein